MALLIGVLWTGACATTPDAPSRLGGADLHDALLGSYLRLVDGPDAPQRQPNHFQVLHQADGEGVLTRGSIEYAGSWWVEADRVCYRFDGRAESRTDCYAVTARGPCLRFHAANAPERVPAMDVVRHVARTMTLGEPDPCEP